MKLRILGLLVGVPWGVILNITIGARGVLSFVVGSAVCYAAYPLVCYLSKSNAPDNRPAVAGKVRRDVGFDFDAAITRRSHLTFCGTGAVIESLHSQSIFLVMSVRIVPNPALA